MILHGWAQIIKCKMPFQDPVGAKIKMPFASLRIPRPSGISQIPSGSRGSIQRSIPPLKGSRGSLFEIKGREIEGQNDKSKCKV